METPRASAPPEQKDDTLTLIAIAAVVCVIGDVFHEGLGHGVTAWLSGAHRITVSTVAMQSNIDTRLISAAGTFLIIYLTKVHSLLNNPLHGIKPHFFLGLAAGAVRN